MINLAIVDDQDILREGLKMMFSKKDDIKVVSTGENGREAYEICRGNHVDVMLLDIKMPVMDGMECARTIRKLSDAKKAKTPIVAITGNAKNYSEEDFKEAGFDDALMKPLNFDRLVEVVAHLTE